MDILTYFVLIFIFVEKHLQCDNKSLALHCFHTFTVDLQSLVECLSNRKLLYVIVEGVGSTSVEAVLSNISSHFKLKVTNCDSGYCSISYQYSESLQPLR